MVARRCKPIGAVTIACGCGGAEKRDDEQLPAGERWTRRRPIRHYETANAFVAHPGNVAVELRPARQLWQSAHATSLNAAGGKGRGGGRATRC